MKTQLIAVGIALSSLLLSPPPAHAGGRYPMSITKIHGNVQVRYVKPGGHWRPARTGSLDGGPYLLRTGPNSYAHLSGKFRCVDANSLLRINRDSEASIEVLRGQMSAVDGKRGKSLPDKLN